MRELAPHRPPSPLQYLVGDPIGTPMDERRTRGRVNPPITL